MAFHLPNISHSSSSLVILQSTTKSPLREKLVTTTTTYQKLNHNNNNPSLKLEIPPQTVDAQPDKELSTSKLTSTDNSNNSNNNKQKKNDFYVNVGLTVRTLREDLPLLFSKDLNYDIYRDDITFIDPLNPFTGMEKYKLIFWALRFHGRVLFREISLEVLRVWKPSKNVILIRWNLRGIPRVPWEASRQFQGTSIYKLDRNGKIYEHKVDNLAFNFPRQLRPATSVLDLVAAYPPSPNPTFMWGLSDEYSSSWLDLYCAVRGALNNEGYLLQQRGLVTCS
ncbi:hypothetical protein C5167_008735 [Papaver somniferum]|uniref:Uncharacterized protein n=1 Tax=Papaver somniferum TaxID=3469 RepID=A0A4Y7JZB1_PAPSO|nr:uncharacterized protein LOC113285587 [Papaver somniferum]RZC65045.1 hypothetical protein C5167_008735 [Papaver somniferum]